MHASHSSSARQNSFLTVRRRACRSPNAWAYTHTCCGAYCLIPVDHPLHQSTVGGSCASDAGQKGLGRGKCRSRLLRGRPAGSRRWGRDLMGKGGYQRETASGSPMNALLRSSAAPNQHRLGVPESLRSRIRAVILLYTQVSARSANPVITVCTLGARHRRSPILALAPALTLCAS